MKLKERPAACLLISLDWEWEQLPARDKARSIALAAQLGGLAGMMQRIITGKPRRAILRDYVNNVVEPAYIAGACGSGLIDAWNARVTALEDPLIVALADCRWLAFERTFNAVKTEPRLGVSTEDYVRIAQVLSETNTKPPA